MHSRIRLWRSILAVSCVAALSAGIACSSEEDPAGATACEQIMDACHLKDPGLPGNPVTECHSADEEGEAACQAAIDEGCLETCENAPELEHDGGHEHEEGDAGEHTEGDAG